MNGIRHSGLPNKLALHDIHLPPDPSWWPPAPGWWALSLLALASAVVAFVAYRRVRSRKRRGARILAEFRQLTARCTDDANFAAAIHQFLRRTAWCYAAEAHHLQGEAWRNVLGQMPVDATTLDTLMTLEARMYQPQAQFDRVAVEAAAYRWLQSAIRHPGVVHAETGHA